MAIHDVVESFSDTSFEICLQFVGLTDCTIGRHQSCLINELKEFCTKKALDRQTETRNAFYCAVGFNVQNCDLIRWFFTEEAQKTDATHFTKVRNLPSAGSVREDTNEMFRVLHNYAQLQLKHVKSARHRDASSAPKIDFFKTNSKLRHSS